MLGKTPVSSAAEFAACGTMYAGSMYAGKLASHVLASHGESVVCLPQPLAAVNSKWCLSKAVYLCLDS